ncbi:hypothetical protein KJ554_14065 [bacterium]|nr:hypothetical protein [bacterium]
MHLELQHGADVHRLAVRRDGVTWRVTLDGAASPVEILANDGAEVAFALDGARGRAYVARRGSERLVFLDGVVYTLRLPDEDEGDDLGDPGEHEPNLVAKMPGIVVKVLVAEGDRVAAGAPLLIMEAMKMETEIVSPLDGRVARVHAAAGQVLAAGEPLLDLEPEA